MKAASNSKVLMGKYSSFPLDILNYLANGKSKNGSDTQQKSKSQYKIEKFIKIQSAAWPFSPSVVDNGYMFLT